MDHGLDEDLVADDLTVATMTLAPATTGAATAADRMAREITAIGYGLFALQQAGTLHDLAEVAGTVEATGRVTASRAAEGGPAVVEDVTPSRAEAVPSRAAESTPVPARASQF